LRNAEKKQNFKKSEPTELFFVWKNVDIDHTTYSNDITSSKPILKCSSPSIIQTAEHNLRQKEKTCYLKR